jgi:hypothetical protein
MTRTSLLALAFVLALGLSAALVSQSSAAGTRPEDGLYGEQETSPPSTTYANGSVDLYVIKGGRQLQGSGSGQACYTGESPPSGVPTNDEVKIHLPRNLTISGDGSFSYSGPVTLGPEDTQYEELTIKTTFTIKGRFKRGPHGSWTAAGTARSPICQASSATRFKVELDD